MPFAAVGALGLNVRRLGVAGRARTGGQSPAANDGIRERIGFALERVVDTADGQRRLNRASAAAAEKKLRKTGRGAALTSRRPNVDIVRFGSVGARSFRLPGEERFHQVIAPRASVDPRQVGRQLPTELSILARQPFDDVLVGQRPSGVTRDDRRGRAPQADLSAHVGGDGELVQISRPERCCVPRCPPDRAAPSGPIANSTIIEAPRERGIETAAVVAGQDADVEARCAAA
jgi:hypothetical protein